MLSARWFADLPEDQKIRWPVVRGHFKDRYCNLVNDWAENVCLRSITQSPDMPVEIYLNKFCEQARRMGKPLAACIPDLVGGLVYDIQKEVILRCPQTPDEVIKHAKLAEVVTRRDKALEKNGLKSLFDEVKQVTKGLSQQGKNSQESKDQVRLVQYEQGATWDNSRGETRFNVGPNNSGWRGRSLKVPVAWRNRLFGCTRF